MRASHILLEFVPERPDRNQGTRARGRKRAESEQLAGELRDRILDGEAFSDLARTYSDCPSRHEGGDLGRFGRGQMHSRFEAAAFALEVDELSGVVETPFGFHLIRRTE